MKWHTEIKKISELKNWEDNPRTITEEEFDELVSSVDDLGNFDPLVINTDGTVIAGNQRLRVSQKLGHTEIEVSVPERKLTKKEVKKIGIISNRHSGEWDMDKLANGFEDVLEEIGAGDLMPEIVEEVEEDDYEEPENLETTVVLGDVYQLGEHRLMCGDSTKIEDVERLMNKEKATLGFNDPPYGMKKENEGVLGDNMNYDDLLQFNKDWISLQFTYLKDNGSWYCWGIDEPLMDVYNEIIKPYIKTQKATFRNLITWDKGNGQGQMSEDFRMFPIADEKCLFIMCGVQGFSNNADNYFEGWNDIVNYLDLEKNKAKLTIKDCKRLAGHSPKSGCHWFDKSQWMLPTEEVYNSWKFYCKQNNVDAFKKEYDELKKEYDSTRAYFNNTHDNQNNVWHFERTNNEEKQGARGHPTPKPVALCNRAIKSSCPEEEIVTDWFGGSGSTLIACEQTNRKCYMMELDEHYCQVIIDRWEEFTGKKVVKLD